MAEKIEVQLLVDTKTSEKNVENLNKDLKETSSDISSIENAADKATGGMVSGFKGAASGLKGVTKGFKTVGGAIKASGLGLLVITITALTAAFTRSEEGQNKFAKIMGVLGAVTDVFADKIADLGELIIDIFTKPSKVLEDFSNSIQIFVMDKVDKVIKGMGLLGTAITKAFSGDFKGALEDAGSGFVELNRGLNPAVILTESLVKSTKELTKELVEEGKKAGEIADMRAKADKVERQLQIDRAKADRDRAELLEQAVNKEKFSVEERISFLEEAGKLEEEITNKEIAAAKLRLDAKIAENALGKSNKADLDEEAALKAQLIQLETARLTKQKEVTSQTIALKAEEAAALKAIEDQKKADEEEAKLLADEEAAAKKLKQEEADKAEIERKQKLADEEKAIEEQKRAQQEETFNNAVALAGAETKLGKMLLLAKQLLLAKEFVLNAKAQIANAKKAVGDAVVSGAESSTEVAGSVAKAANTSPPPFNIPFILTALATGASVMSAVNAAISSTKSAAARIGGGGGGSMPTSPSITPVAPPAFNVVGQGGTSQLADAISNQAPMRAYVVSNDVTTAQGLERNIVEGATI